MDRFSYNLTDSTTHSAGYLRNGVNQGFLPQNRKPDLSTLLSKSLAGEKINMEVNIKIKGLVDTSKIKGFVPLDSEQGKAISEEETMRREIPINCLGKFDKHNSFDDYKPVYEQTQFDPFPRLIGYRPMTPEEKSGNVMY